MTDYRAEPPTKASDQIGTRPKRFWKAAAATDGEGGVAVALDGRPVKTPQGQALVLPTRGLAEKVAAEWEAVKDHVEYADMPLTRLGFAAVDRMNDLLPETVAEVLRYAETDLLCYPSEYPEALIAREDAAWKPLLQWAQAELGLAFHQNRTLIHQAQPQETSARISSLILEMSAHERAGLMSAIPLFGSVILALALWRGHIGGDAAFAASRVGEDFQAETWGRDAEAAKRAEGMKAQALSLETWFRALG
jgi:chaperone required for assembly of F1-ATPase